MSEGTQAVLLSALQHYSYCPRQCALIHQEQIFDENEFTLRGRRAHRRVEAGETTVEAGRRVARSFPLYSEKYQLIGKADVVEFLDDGTPYPVEYKHGRRQKRVHDDIQLAAQALCLEEMTGMLVQEGAVYSHKTRRRRVVKITAALRKQVIDTAEKVRAMLAGDALPRPVDDRSLCRACSLQDQCQPDLVAGTKTLASIRRRLFSVENEDC
ncbi:MAG: CRISPR-associated protein Cas4 [Pseudomonadota bacterium]